MKSNFRNTISIYLGSALKHKWQLLASWVAFSSGVLIVRFLGPIITGNIFNLIARGEQEWSAYTGTILLYVGIVTILAEILIRIGMYFYSKSIVMIRQDIAQTAFRALSEKDATFYKNNFAGSLISKSNRFITGWFRIQSDLTFYVVTSVLIFLFSMGYVFYVLPLLGAVIFSLGVLLSAIVIKMIRSGIKYNKETAAQNSRTTGLLSDIISNIQLVKSSGREADEQSRFNTQHQRQMEAAKKSLSYKQLRVDPASQVGGSVLVIISMLFAIAAARTGELEVGTVFVLATFSYDAADRLFELTRNVRNFEEVLSDAYEMMDIISQPNTVLDSPTAKSYRISKGSISFDNVSFAFRDDPETMVIKNLDLDIAPGEKIGLVGSSGGGKSTMTNLILRMEDVVEGSISIDGRDIRDFKQRKLRSQIGLVSQEPILFHRSLAENISYTRPNATQKQIETAAKKAYAHDFILSTKDGYQTLVGERGVKLSGGQRQRIALARSILADSRILLLDEATSALDSESEAYIQKALFKLMKGRTSIVIAHRLSTIQKMDRIIVLDKGHIVEQGSHDQLIAKDGAYSKLWQRQSGGFLES